MLVRDARTGPNRKSVPVLFNNVGLTKNTLGKEIQIIRCNMHTTEYETRKVASCIHIVRECSTKCNFKKFKPTWIRSSEHFIEKTSPDITISEASLEIAMKITFNWLIKQQIKICTLVALWLQPYYGPWSTDRSLRSKSTVQVYGPSRAATGRLRSYSDHKIYILKSK